MENEKLALSIKECAGRLGISKSLCYEMARTGQIPVLKCGQKRLLVPVKALELWLATKTAVPNG
jgi:excisionase family DNA binding protein